MKKLFTSIAFMIGSFAVMAQSCPGTVVATCTPDATTPSATFKPDYTAFPCVTPGVDYSQSLSFKIPSSVTQPQQADIDSVEFLSLDNLPCGLCWKLDRPSKRYKKNEVGCFLIQGNSSDVAGQYKLNIQMRAWLVGSTTPVGPVSTDLANLIHYVRVKDAQGNCPAVNTGGTNANAQTGCALGPVGIAEVKAIASVSIVPNPLRNSSVVSFESKEDGMFTFQTLDMVGKIVASVSTTVTKGANSIKLERNNLPAGVYFLKASNGTSTSTFKFVIAD